MVANPLATLRDISEVNGGRERAEVAVTHSPGNSGPGGMEEAPTQTDVIDAEASSRTAAIVGAVLLLSVSRTVAGGLAAWCTC